MKTIEQLAREAGAAQDEGLTYFEANELQRFHDAAIAQYREGLLAGVGEPYYPQWSHSNEFAAYTADQLVAAVLAERERCAKVCDDLGYDTAHACAAAIRGQR